MAGPAGDAVAEGAALAANEAFYRALGAADAGAMEAMWARRAPVTCLHPGWTLLSGREAVLASWAGILANPNQPRIVGGGASVTLLGGDAALVLCREVVSGAALYATNVFVREDGAWRLAHHHSGPVMAEGR